jgi:hypothetical protein
MKISALVGSIPSLAVNQMEYIASDLFRHQSQLES